MTNDIVSLVLRYYLVAYVIKYLYSTSVFLLQLLSSSLEASLGDHCSSQRVNLYCNF